MLPSKIGSNSYARVKDRKKIGTDLAIKLVFRKQTDVDGFHDLYQGDMNFWHVEHIRR
jgi:hypothetical protein